MNNTNENELMSSVNATMNGLGNNLKITVRNCGNIVESAFKKDNYIKVKKEEYKRDPGKNTCSEQIATSNDNIWPANKVKVKKKRFKSTSSHVQSKDIIKFKAEIVSDNEISNLDAETLNLTTDEACKFLLSCRFCRKEFETLENFKDHECNNGKCNTSVKTLKCKYCLLTFTEKRRLDKHVKDHKRNNCTICNAQFTKRKALCKHLKIEHNIKEPEKLYNCSFCDKHFPKRSSLNAHLKKHADGQHVCVKCGFMCDNENVYAEHLKEHIENLKYECQLCEKKFVRRQQYDQHMMGHERHSCSPCNITFSTKKLLLKHQQSVHGVRIIEKKYECPICKKLFLRPKHLQIHQRIHTGEKPVKCSHCEINFCNDRALSKHMKTVRHLQRVSIDAGKVIEIEKPFLCSECGARFYRRKSLFRHTEVIHSVSETFKCPHCDYNTKCKPNLKRHVELHTDTKRFICEICGSSFRAFATLKEHHAFVHSENRGFICTVCNKGFKSKSDLQRHMRIHSEVRPYKCHCNRDYKRMSHLKRHMASAHCTTVKKNQISIISESTNLDANDQNISAALIESLEALPDNVSADDFSLLTAANTAIYNHLHDSVIKEDSDEEHMSTASAGGDKYSNVPSNTMQTFLDKSNVHIISDSGPKNNLIPFVSAPSVKTPPMCLQTDHSVSSSVSLDDPNLNSSSSNFCNFNLPSSPLGSISVEHVTLQHPIVSQDVLSFSSSNDSVIRPHSLPNLNFQNQTSNIDSFVPFSLQNSDSPIQIPSFLLSSDISSPSHVTDLNLEQNAASKQLFGDPDDILSLQTYTSNSQLNGINCPSENPFNTGRDIELWDTGDNSNRLKLPGSELTVSSTCANTNFSTNLTYNTNNLLTHSLIFSNDSLMVCSLDANTLNSDFDSLANLC